MEPVTAIITALIIIFFVGLGVLELITRLTRPIGTTSKSPTFSQKEQQPNTQNEKAVKDKSAPSSNLQNNSEENAQRTHSASKNTTDKAETLSHD